MRSHLNDVAERALQRTGSRFMLVGAIVSRSAQLGAGFPPEVTGVELDKTVTTALREIAAGAVEVNPNKRRTRREEAA